ncbi:MAG: LamG domain-containing protein [Rhodocyclaceae bacterium]|nr:LamG domain-containing protein [Rhodocyclaceae bacterium]
MNPINRTVSQLAAAATVALSGSAYAAVIAHWDFSGPAGTTASTISDVSGNGHNGTAINGPVYESLGGGSGLRFDGLNDRVFVSDSAAFRSPSLTVEAVVTLDALPGPGNLDQIVFRGDTRSGRDPFYLGILDNRARFYIEGSGGAVAVHSSVTLPLGVSFHLAGTIDDATGQMRLFLDGVEVGSTTTVHRPDTLALNGAFTPGLGIGNLQDGQNQFLDGVIDEVRISDVALRADQLLGASVVGGGTVPEPGSLALLAGALGLLAWRQRRVPAA